MRSLRAALPHGARLAGGLVALLGLIVLGAWWRAGAQLSLVFPGWMAMRANTALLCILGGTSLMLLASPEGASRARAAGVTCAVVATALAALTVAEYLFSIDLRIDRLLVPTGARQSGRPSLQSAAAFLLAGLALLSMGGGVAQRLAAGPTPTQVLALLSASIPVVALLGYAFGVPGLYGMTAPRAHTGMAVHSAVALLALAAGIVAARPEVGLAAIVTSQHAGGVTARQLLLGLPALLPAACLVIVGRRLGWYSEPVVTALLVLLGLGGGLIFIFVTAVRLERDDLSRLSFESRLRDSEARFRDLFEQAVEGVFIADLDGRYTDVNVAGCRILGRRRDEIVGKRIVDFIPEEDVARLGRARENQLEGHNEVSEWTLRRADGSYVPVEVSGKIMPDGRWQAFVRDISDRKRAEAQIRRGREEEAHLRADLEQITRASAKVSESALESPVPDVTAVLRTIATQAQVLTGARYVGVGLGSDPDEPFDPWISLGVAPAAAFERHPRPVALPATELLVVVPIRHRGRAIGNLLLADKEGATAFSDRDRWMVEILAARAAITIESVNLYAGEAGRRSWLRRIIDQMPEGVMLLDSRGRVEAMNRALLALACEDEGTVDDRGNPAIFDVRAPDGTPIPFEQFLVVRALQRGEPATDQEHLVRQRDGRFVPVLVSASPVRDDAGRITGAVAIIRDMTTLKELERLREEWASVVAHDLRQPVGAISLTAESLSRLHHGDLPQRERKAIERIQSASGRLNRMIEDLLDASRIEAKHLSVEPHLADLCTVVDAVVENQRGVTAGFEVRIVSEPELEAWIDPDRIHQVLGNLISNAAKYGRPGTEITIACAARGDLIEVTVTNRGSGIPADELPSLFGRFKRTREARADRTPGLGLGLYISKGLIEAHGGRMWAESVPGVSASFHFTVRRTPDELHLHGGMDAQPPA